MCLNSLKLLLPYHQFFISAKNRQSETISNSELTHKQTDHISIPYIIERCDLL